MNREIKFRGLRIDGRGWVWGDLVRKEYSTYICCNYRGKLPWERETFHFKEYTVKPQTVSQFTGARDKNGRDIYEGDINQDKGIVIWNKDDCSFNWHYAGIETIAFDSEHEWCEIIGNIHDKEVTNG